MSPGSTAFPPQADMEWGSSVLIERERIHLSMLLLSSVLMVFGLFSAVVLSSGIIATLWLAIAALVISIGEWKTRFWLLPRFKSLPMPAHKPHRYRSLPLRFKK
jgi:hypothetical protein